MNADFESVKIGEFIEITDFVANGSFASLKDNVEYKESPDYAVLVRLVDHNSGWSGERVYVTQKAYNFLKKSSVIPGDVIISNVGANAGTVFRAPDIGVPMTLGPNSVLLKPRDDKPFARDYIYYFFSGGKGQHILKSILSGSAQPKFNKTDLRKSEIEVPKNRDYKLYAKPLLNLDSKIELNRQINQTLEQIAQTIFKSWFVDFEPVKAKIAAKAAGRDPERAAMCAISGKLEPELDQISPEQYQQLAATAALFPDELVAHSTGSGQASELGLIPVGWEVGSFEKCCVRVESGGTPSRKQSEYWNGSVPWLTSGEVRDVIVLDTKEKISAKGLASSSAKLWPAMSTVVAMYGATAGQICLLANETAANQACCALIPKKEFQSYVFFTARRSIEDLAGKASGSAQQNLNKSLVSNHPVVMPSRAVANCFETMTSPLIEKWIVNQQESQKLADLRNSLLPKLLSGEIDFEQAQPAMERAV